ncbi:DNA-directed RNA polymerase [Scenedesmus sp. NREL 46B-D3]|nr:DNA-directed RNA polymerase [Scenedesmus sp. NREL 46B-D3]
MNQPDRYSRFVLPEGKDKVEYRQDTKLKNAGQYVIRLEDHTVGNMLRQQLHSDEAVVFAGYRIPHPLDPLMVVRIQTTDAKQPQEAMAHALLDLKAEIAELKTSLAAQVPRPVDPATVQQQQYMAQQQQAGMDAMYGQQGGFNPAGYGAPGGYGGY